MARTARISLAAVLTALVAGPGVVAGQQAGQHDRHQGVGAAGDEVMLTACVEPAKDAGTFILTHAADVPVHPATMGRVVYWLDSVEELRKHVGHQVRIDATIDKVEQSEMDITPGEDRKGGVYVEIEGPGKNVTTTPDKAGVPPAARSRDEIQTTLVRLKVGDIRQAAASCPLSPPSR